jgi:Flp pilus assembly protein TadD
VAAAFEDAMAQSLLRAQQGRLAEAIELANRAVSLNGDSAEALAHLGTILLQLGRSEEAAAYLERAIAANPRLPHVHNNLGSALLRLARIDEAVSAYRSAVALEPLYSEAWNNLALALRLLGRIEEAIPCFEAASTTNPNNAKAWGDLGNALLEMGRINEARAAFERAIALEPKPSYLLGLSGVRRFAADDPHVATMQRLLETVDSLPPEGRVDLHFALGKVYADTGEAERSFRHLLAGNALRRSLEAYDEAATLASAAALPKVFTRGIMTEQKGHGNTSHVPLFILGMPRSGSTLVEQILAAHPAVRAGGELGFFEEAVANVFPGAGEAMTPARLNALGENYVHKLRGLAPDALRVTDKMPSNVRFVGLIGLALPNARIIYTRRDPLDTCISCFSILFESQPQTNDLAELGRYYRAQEALMEHWRAVLEPGTILDVHYEEVVADLETQARRIIAHAGLPWDDACLSFHKVARPVQTASSVQVRKPIYNSSIGRWRPYAHLLAPLFDALKMSRLE